MIFGRHVREFADLRWDAQVMRSTWIPAADAKLLIEYAVILALTNRAGEDWMPVFDQALDALKNPSALALLLEVARELAGQTIVDLEDVLSDLPEPKEAQTGL